MPKKAFIIVRGDYEFSHLYADAPEEVAYLRNLHRHIFNYEVEIEVFHNDRELEFIMVKHQINKFVKASCSAWPMTTSCERMAMDIGSYLRANYGFERELTVSVFEDNENGAKVIM